MVEQQCHICRQWFDRLVTHWGMSCACQVVLQVRNMETIPENISLQNESANDIQHSVRDMGWQISLQTETLL